MLIRLDLSANAASLSGEVAVRDLPEEDALFLDVLVNAVNNPQPKRKRLWPSAGMKEKLQAEVAMFKLPQPKVSASVANFLLRVSSAIRTRRRQKGPGRLRNLLCEITLTGRSCKPLSKRAVWQRCLEAVRARMTASGAE